MAAEFIPLKEHIGSIVHLKDRSDMFDPAVVAECRARLEERTVLVFPKANLTDDEQLHFTDLFGGRIALSSDSTGELTDEVYKVTLDKKVNKQPEYVLGTFFWHMDGITVDMAPPIATLLSARAVAPKGGQTEFASTFAAYNHLPEAEKKQLEGMRAVHSVRAALRPIEDAIPEEDRERVMTIGTVNEHPIVWKRKSGNRSMVIGTTADHVVGMPVPHGRALLTRLVEWAAQPDFSYRHDWQLGDFAVWDNTGALHRVVPYDADSGRMMHRTAIAGVDPVE